MAPRLRQVKPPADAAPANSEASPSVSKATSPNSSTKSVLAWDTVGAGTGTLGQVSDRKDRLGLLHVALKDLADELDDEANVPERYETTGKGSLADMDAEVLRLATGVVHRLLLWEMFPLVSPESYFEAGE